MSDTNPHKKKTVLSQRQKDVILGIVVIVTALSAMVTGYNNQKIRDQNHELRQTQQCTTNTFSDLLISLNDRTALTQPVNEADTKQNRKLAEILGVSLQPKDQQPTPQEGKKLISDWLLDLNTWLALRDSQSKDQKQNPFPSNFGFENCLIKAKNGEDVKPKEMQTPKGQ